MNLRGVKIVAISATAGMAITVLGAVAIAQRISKRKKRKDPFLSDRKRRVITDVLELAAKDVPHGPLGASLYRKHLQGLSDKRLLVLYAAVKVGEFVRGSGIDPTKVTRDQLENIKSLFTRAQAEKANDRKGLLNALFSHDAADLKPLLITALGVLVLAK